MYDIFCVKKSCFLVWETEKTKTIKNKKNETAALTLTPL